METKLLPVTRERVESLVSSFHSENPDIVSIYIDNQTLKIQTVFQSTTNSLVEEILKTKPKRVKTGAFSKQDAEQIKSFLNKQWEELSNQEHCGVAFFIQPKTQKGFAFRLSQKVENGAFLGRYPIVAPLFSMIEESIGLLLLQKQEAKFMTGTPTQLHLEWTVDSAAMWEETETGKKDRPRHKTLKHQMREHLNETNRRLLQSSKQKTYDHLIIACKANLKGEVEEHLHSYVKDRLICFKEGDYYALANGGLLEQVVEPSMIRFREFQEQNILENLENIVGTGVGTSNVEEVLEALWEERVDELFYTQGCELSGYWGESGFLHTKGGNCPLYGEPLNKSNNILERAIQQACRTGAKITPVQQGLNNCLVGKLRSPTLQSIVPQVQTV